MSPYPREEILNHLLRNVRGVEIAVREVAEGRRVRAKEGLECDGIARSQRCDQAAFVGRRHRRLGALRRLHSRDSYDSRGSLARPRGAGPGQSAELRHPTERFFHPRGFGIRSVLPPVPSGNAKWFDRHTSQEVCPWNEKFARPATEPAFTPRPELIAPDIPVFAKMDDTEFEVRFGDTPLSRAKRAGLVRNAIAAQKY